MCVSPKVQARHPGCHGRLHGSGFVKNVVGIAIINAAFGALAPGVAQTGAGWGTAGPVAWAIRTDRRSHWSPERYSTPELEAKVTARLEAERGNAILRQLKTCALVYRCLTSQNIFYERVEGAIPASVACIARFVCCISDQP